MQDEFSRVYIISSIGKVIQSSKREPGRRLVLHLRQHKSFQQPPSKHITQSIRLSLAAEGGCWMGRGKEALLALSPSGRLIPRLKQAFSICSILIPDERFESLIRTLGSVTSVFVLERFNCILTKFVFPFSRFYDRTSGCRVC